MDTTRPLFLAACVLAYLLAVKLFYWWRAGPDNRHPEPPVGPSLVIATALATALALAAGIWAANAQPVDFDEAYNLQISRNLVDRGLYTTTTIAGDKLFDPAITTGPTVLVPMAALFQLTGVSVDAARYLMVALLALCLIAYVAVAHLLFGRLAALVAIPLFFAGPDIFVYGPVVVGELPATLLLFCGILAYARGLGRQSALWLSLSGVAFGLAIVTKYQAGLVVVSLCLAATVAVRRGRPRHRRGLLLAPGLALAMPIAWLVLQAFLAGAPLLQDNLSALAIQIKNTGPRGPFVEGLSAQWVSSWAWTNPLLLIAGLVYGGVASLRDDGRRETRLILLSFSFLWLLWWFAANTLHWSRYFLPGYLTAAPAAAALVSTSAQGIGTHLRAAITVRPRLAALAIPLVAVAAYLWSVAPLRGLPELMQSAAITRAEERAIAGIVQTLPEDAVFVGYDHWFVPWSLGLLTARPIGTLVGLQNDPHARDIYVVITPIQKKHTGVNPLITEYLRGNGTPVVVGQFEVYKLYSGAGSVESIHSLRSTAYCASWSRVVVPSRVGRGTTFRVASLVENCGSFEWPGDVANAIGAGYHWLTADGSAVLIEDDGARSYIRTTVVPGQSKSVALAVAAPRQPGAYTLRLDLVHEGIAWFSWQGAYYRDVPVEVD